MGQPTSSRLTQGSFRPFSSPRAAALLVGACSLVSVVNPAAQGPVFRWLDLALKITAGLAAGVIAAWTEERLYARQANHGPAPRFAAALTVPALALVLTPALLLVLGVAGVLVGDDGTLAVAVLAGGLWLGSAGLGSLVVLVLDVAVSALVPDLRTRFQVAVLGLLAIAVAAAMLVYRAGEAVAAWIDALDPATLPLEGLGGSTRLALLAQPRASALATTLFFACAAAIALPAVLSACSKLAEMVVARLRPLRRAFRSLAQGDFDARVEAGGSRELLELGQSFNQMAESLVEAREEVQRLNEELEGEVATRTRELRDALDELQEAQTRLVETEKHAMLSRLTAGLLHEVNSPLGALRSATDTIRRSSSRIVSSLEAGAATSPAGAEPPALLRAARASVTLADIVVESTHRIEELMNSLRRFVSLDSAERKSIDVCQALEFGLDLIRPSLGARILVDRDWATTPLLVSCFPARLNQIFLNLLQNAAEALAGTDAGTLRVTASAHGETVTVAITDSGRGMSPQQLQGLFDFGFTEKQGGRVGLRLGLPSSKRWVDELGGSIDVASTVGVGTTVAVRLPLTRGGNEIENAARAGEPHRHRGAG